MKIAFISHATSSIMLFRLPLIKALAKNHEVFIICPGEIKLSFAKHILWDCKDGFGTFSNIKDFLQLFFILKKYKFDMLISCAHKANTFSLIACLPLRIKKSYAIIEGRGNLLLLGGFKALVLRLLYKISFFSNAHFISVNEANAKLLQSWGLNPKRISIIKSAGVDTKRFLPIKANAKERQHFAKKHGLNPKLLNVIMIARPLIFKGCKEYFSVAARLKNEANFLFLGSLPKKPNEFYVSQEDFANAQINALCVLPPTKDVANLLRFCDIFCLPSHAEGLSMSVLEAKASGCALILSWAEGNVEAAQNAIDALFVGIGNADELEDGIKTLLHDENLRKVLVANALKDIARFDVDFVIKKYLELFGKDNV